MRRFLHLFHRVTVGVFGQLLNDRDTLAVTVAKAVDGVIACFLALHESTRQNELRRRCGHGKLPSFCLRLLRGERFGHGKQLRCKVMHFLELGRHLSRVLDC